jgi:hypothetical protein
MKIHNNLHQTVSDGTRDLNDKAHDLAEKTSVKARAKGQEAYERSQSGLKKVAVLATAGGLLLEGFLRSNEKKTRQNLQDATHKARHLQGKMQDALQPTLSKAQDLVQDNFDPAQQKLKKSLKSAQETLQVRAKGTQKDLKLARKAAQKRLVSGWSTTQEMLEEGSKRIQQGLEKVATDTAHAEEALRERRKQRQSKRTRARFLFRGGLISGVVLALLLTPLSGAEARKHVGSFLSQCKQLFRPS